MQLQVQNLAYSIDGKPILSNVSFSVFKGEKWAIIGRNGAGKSTLIRCIAGLAPAHAGSVCIDNKPLALFSAKQRGKAIAYVPQTNDYRMPFTVYDFVMMGRFPYFGLMAKALQEDKKIVEESLEITELTEYADRRMDSLSGGELQRVFIAGAVAQRTPLMLLDEPTTFLDPNHQYRIKKALDRIHDTFGVAIITVTHEISSIFANYTHILALKAGAVVFSGACSSIESSQTDFLTNIFDVAFETFHSPEGEKLLAPRAEM